MIIVTDGSGFIGNNIVKGLNDKRLYDSLIVDNLGKSEKFRNLVGLRYRDYQYNSDFWEAVTKGCWDNSLC